MNAKIRDATRKSTEKRELQILETIQINHFWISVARISEHMKNLHTKIQKSYWSQAFEKAKISQEENYCSDQVTGVLEGLKEIKKFLI